MKRAEVATKDCNRKIRAHLETATTRDEVHPDLHHIRRSSNSMQTMPARGYAIPICARSIGDLAEKLLKPTFDPNNFEG